MHVANTSLVFFASRARCLCSTYLLLVRYTHRHSSLVHVLHPPTHTHFFAFLALIGPLIFPPYDDPSRTIQHERVDPQPWLCTQATVMSLVLTQVDVLRPMSPRQCGLVLMQVDVLRPMSPRQRGLVLTQVDVLRPMSPRQRGLGWDWEDHFSPFGINGVRNEPFHIIWPISSVQGQFFICAISPAQAIAISLSSVLQIHTGTRLPSNTAINLD